MIKQTSITALRTATFLQPTSKFQFILFGMNPRQPKSSGHPKLQHSQHKQLMTCIISKFLPEWGHDAKPIIVRGQIHFDKKEAATLFGAITNRLELPDIVSYSESKNWLFLIEAVHSSGPISSIRLLELKRLAKECTADIVFVTAFLTRDIFRKFAPDIAWETEVWIADAPDHMVHFDGDKFLGPYKTK